MCRPRSCRPRLSPLSARAGSSGAFALWQTLALTCLLAGGAGCGDDPEDLGATGSYGASDGDSDDDPDTGDDAEEAVLVPARGISIVEVEANQGTRVALTDADGEWVGPDARNMKLVRDRDTLIRIHYVVDENWRERPVVARLTLDTGVGAPIVHEQTREVAGDSSRTGLERAFYFGLTAAAGETMPGTTIQVELLEPSEDAALETPPEPDRPRVVAPVDGPAWIGFESDAMQLKVLLVPIHYTGGGKDTVPELDEAHAKQLVDALHERNPVQEVVYQIRGQIEYDKPLDNLGSLLPLMAAVKQADGADANVYYHAFIDIGCPVVGCGAMGVAGIANLAGDSQAASLTRVGASVWWRSPNTGTIAQTIGTFVHEVGHNQGLAHVACPGVQAAGPDPAYPYADGKIGQWGFGIRSFTLHNPTSSHDYMSYCGNTWGSDWTYAKAYARIQTLTQWDLGDASEGAEPEPLLVGALYPDGAEEWFVLPGEFELESLVPDEQLVFVRDGVRVEQPATIVRLSDGATRWVIGPMPAATTLAELDHVEHRHAGAVRRVIPREAIVDVAEIRPRGVAGFDLVPGLGSGLGSGLVRGR